MPSKIKSGIKKTVKNPLNLVSGPGNAALDAVGNITGIGGVNDFVKGADEALGGEGTSTQTVQLPAFQEEGLTDLFARARTAADQVDTRTFENALAGQNVPRFDVAGGGGGVSSGGKFPIQIGGPGFAKLNPNPGQNTFPAAAGSGFPGPFQKAIAAKTGGGGGGLFGGVADAVKQVAGNIFDSRQPAPFDASFTPRLAGVDPNQLGAINSAIDLGQGLQGAGSNSLQDFQSGFDQTRQLAGQFEGLGNEAINLGQSQLRGDFLDPASNPFIEKLAQAVTRPQVENFQENILPGLRSQAVSQGAFGGDREGILTANAAQNLNRDVLDARDKIFGTNFMNERQIQQNSPSLLASGAQLNSLSPEMLLGLGQGQLGLQQQGIDTVANAGQRLRGFDQEKRDAIFEAFNRSRTAPFAAVNQLAPAIKGINAGQTTTQETDAPFGSGLFKGGLAVLNAAGGAKKAGLF